MPTNARYGTIDRIATTGPTMNAAGTPIAKYATLNTMLCRNAIVSRPRTNPLITASNLPARSTIRSWCLSGINPCANPLTPTHPVETK